MALVCFLQRNGDLISETLCEQRLVDIDPGYGTDSNSLLI